MAEENVKEETQVKDRKTAFDFVNLKPDYMSILIGVNDVWHEFGELNGVDAEKYNLTFVPLQDKFDAAAKNM